jgi:hypothetical protein
MSNGDCPIGAAHAQQIRLLEENADRVDREFEKRDHAMERLIEKIDGAFEVRDDKQEETTATRDKKVDKALTGHNVKLWTILVVVISALVKLVFFT